MRPFRPGIAFTLAVAYYLLGKLGHALAIHPGYASMVWPAAGLSLAALLHFGRSHWVGIFLGSALLSFQSRYPEGGTALEVLEQLLVAGGLGSGSALQAIVGASLVRRFVSIPNDFRRQVDALLFLLLGGPVACMVSSCLGVGTLHFVGDIGREYLLFAWCTWWVGDLFGVMIFSAPLLVFWQTRWQKRREFITTLGIPILVCFAATFLLFYEQVVSERERLELTFEREVTEQTLILEGEIRQNERELESIFSFFAGSTSVDREEFRIFVSSILERHPSMRGVGWARFVGPEERSSYEQGLRSETGVDASIHPVAGRESVSSNSALALTYVEPYEGREYLLGLDFLSDPIRRTAVELALSSRRASATEPTYLVKDIEQKEPSYLLLVPTWTRADSTEERPTGCVVAAFRVSDLCALAWERWDRSTIAMTLADVSGDPVQMLTLNLDLPQTGYSWEKVIDVGGRKWRLRFHLTENYLAANHTREGWYVLLGGLLFTCLAGAFLVIRLGQMSLINELNAKLLTDQQRLDTLLQELLATANEGIVTCDERWTVQTANRTAERILDLPPNELVGRDFRAYLFSLPDGDDSIVEVLGRNRRGEEVPLEVSCSYFALDGESHRLVIFRDIQQRIEQQQQLLTNNAELARSNQELDSFAHIASHDLKEPLRGLNNYASFLLEDYGESLDEEGVRKLNVMVNLTRRMDKLLDSLLHYSRVGRISLKEGQIDPRDLLISVRGSLEISLEQKHVDLVIENEFPSIWGDRVYLEEVFRNLVVNAIKYNDKEKKMVQVGWEPYSIEKHGERVTENGEQLAAGTPIFFVHDNGIGILEKHQEKVFELFKRLHGREAYGGGQGSGLTMVKKIIERHQGAIWLTSTPGQSTTFYFYLARTD